MYLLKWLVVCYGPLVLLKCKGTTLEGAFAICHAFVNDNIYICFIVSVIDINTLYLSVPCTMVSGSNTSGMEYPFPHSMPVSQLYTRDKFVSLTCWVQSDIRNGSKALKDWHCMCENGYFSTILLDCSWTVNLGFFVEQTTSITSEATTTNVSTEMTSGTYFFYFSSCIFIHFQLFSWQYFIDLHFLSLKNNISWSILTLFCRTHNCNYLRGNYYKCVYWND